LGTLKRPKKYTGKYKNEPNNTIADKSYSLIHKYKIDDEHIKVMEEKLTKKFK